MGKEIVINAEKEQTRIAILENGELVELFIENPENTRTIGDICLGKVRKIMPSIQAAFVDIGQKQDAFLHFSDLSDNLAQLLEFVDQDEPHVGKGTQQSDGGKSRGKRRRPRGRRRGKGQNGGEQSAESDGQDGGKNGDGKKRDKNSDAHERGQRRSAQRRAKRRGGNGGGKKQNGNGGGKGHGRRNDDPRPETLLKRDQRILVKIVKEPISNKGSRVSTDISLAGRFVVLVPLADYVAVSKKIYSYKERRRLRALAKSLLPEGFGVIVRTVAEGKNAKALDTDLRLLLEKWRKIEKQLSGRPDPPKHVHQDVNMVSSIVRDLFSDDYERILVDDPRLYRNIKNYIGAVAPQMVPAVKAHKTQGQHVFDATGIARDVKQAFESRVDLPSGGYLFIERTEAMHVVDVNSGRSGRGMTQEENSLRVNLEAARVITRQIRLRDLGGIIVVDFIDLRDEKNKRKVYDELKKEFKKDRAVTKILPMSDFGLVQITRQRLRPSITTTFAAPNGMGDSDAKAAKPEKAPKEAPKEEKKEEKPRQQQEQQRQPRQEQKKEDKPRGDRSRGGRGGRGRQEDRPERRETQVAAVETPPAARAPDELLQEMEQWIVDYKIQGNRRAVILKVHPFTAAYLNRKVPNHPTRWFMKHLVRVRLDVDESLAPEAYRFRDARSGEDLTDTIREAAEKMRD